MARLQAALHRFDAEVKDLIFDGDRVAGVRTPELEVRAELVVGADGRASAVRGAAGLEIAADEAFRGKGVGKALLLAAEALAERWGCLALEVTSLRSRTGAHDFYQRSGYIDVCDRSGRFWKHLG